MYFQSLSNEENENKKIIHTIMKIEISIIKLCDRASIFQTLNAFSQYIFLPFDKR
ncbi:MAG: hypothetical protein LBQ24_07265 [Candidatus Peribacteria bacterium]|jgi:hypothetical protein|nr:hypothetical protein [Candidatus Peribacteria bacterium]